jgi:hypothetical protein
MSLAITNGTRPFANYAYSTTQYIRSPTQNVSDWPVANYIRSCTQDVPNGLAIKVSILHIDFASAR